MKKSFKSYEDLLQEVIDKLEEILERIPKNIVLEDELLDNSDFIRRMKISARLAQSWRDKKLISYSQIGNKIFYHRSDI
ncbi:MAG: DNA-binding protein, partial [Bacteroidota bacterium]